MEAIIDKMIELVKTGKMREIADIRDEIGLDGLKITIDLKRGVDPDKLMNRLFAMTPLQDTFSCNFNVLIAGVPRVMGVRELLDEWIAFRMECVRRRVYFDLARRPRTSCICSRDWKRFCWISTRPSASSGTPRRRTRWFRT